MKTDATTYDDRIAIQPQTTLEQQLVAELFTRLQATSRAPSHPEKVGTELCFYTLDVGEYEELDHDLFRSAEIGVTESGKIDPEVGARALVVVHDVDAFVETGEDVDAAEPDGGDAAEPDVGDADQPDDDADVEEPTHSEAESIATATAHVLTDNDPDYSDLQDCTKMMQEIGYDIPANLAGDVLQKRLRNAVKEIAEG